MRKRIVFQSLLVAVVLFTACSEDKIEPDFRTEGGDRTITFTLPGLGQKVISYAGIADDTEKQLSEIAIYMFNNESDRLERIFRHEEIAIGGSGTDRTASIDATDLSGDRSFYFVGNGEGRSDELAAARIGVTRKADFIEAITDKQTEKLSTPLLMSGKTTIANVSSPTPAELKVDLLRRVARLDIVNNPVTSNFTVKKILVSNAKLQGYVFGDATATPAKTIEEASYDAIEIIPKDAQNPVRMDSVFYLFPTTVKPGVTEIAVEGQFLSETKVYRLKVPSEGVDLLANNRYILNIKKVTTTDAEMELKIVDWTDDANDYVMGTEETDLVTFSAIDMEGGDGIIVSGYNYDITGITKEATLSFTVESFSVLGTSYAVTNASTLPGFSIEASDPVLTYSAKYIQKYTIVIPDRKEDTEKEAVDITIDIENELNPDQKISIKIYSL